jgi:hypothetical protein
VISPTESDYMCLEMIVLASSIMGRKGFLESTPKYPLEPQICFLKSFTHSDYLLSLRRFHCWKLTTGGSKYAPWLALKWVKKDLQNTSMSRAATQTLSITLAPSLVELRNHCTGSPEWHGEIPGWYL